MDPSVLEGSLDEDVDEFSGRFSGTLSFEGSDGRSAMSRDHSTQSLGLGFEDGSKPLKQGPLNVSFEVASVKIVEEPRSKYVVYTILIVSSVGMDKYPVSIERRYSDLDKLNNLLKKKFSNLMQNIAFPKKMLTGNYKSETIAQRSRAFEQYISHLYSLDAIRLSVAFREFFYRHDLVDGYEYIHNAQYEQSVPHLQNVANIEKKILGSDHPDVIATLCALVASYHATEKNKQAQSVGEAALRCIGNNDKNKHLVPLLQLSIRLCWQLGKDKKDLEAELQRLRDRGLQVHGGPSLLELVVMRFQ